MTKRKARPPTWLSMSLLVLTAQRADGLVLAVMVSTSDFVVMGFEVASPKRGVTDLEAASAVFASHAHKVIGQAATLGEGVALAERYTQAWLESDAAAALCACGEIRT